MGYYTYFELTMECSKEQEEQVKKYTDSFTEEDEHNGAWCLAELIQKGFVEAKWYEFDKEFPEFAKKFPDVLFIVYGDGEDRDDIWEARFKGNEMETHCVAMPPFTNEKLFTSSEKINNIKKNA